MGFSGEERLRAVVEVPADRCARDRSLFNTLFGLRLRRLNGILFDRWAAWSAIPLFV